MSVPRARRVRGQALAEFAMVAPVFFLLLFAIIEGGRFMFHYELLNNATREGARYAIVHGSNSSCPSGPMPGGLTNPCDPTGDNVKGAVESTAIGLVDVGDFTTLSVTWPVSNERGQVVTVLAEFAYDPILPLLPQITIKSESSLVINN